MVPVVDVVVVGRVGRVGRGDGLVFRRRRTVKTLYPTRQPPAWVYVRQHRLDEREGVEGGPPWADPFTARVADFEEFAMRDDMSKVLVESLRMGRGSAHAQIGSRRLERNRLDVDDEGAKARFGMKQNGCKHFGEHLGPLYRYLRAQVNRPWRKVYGELCTQLNRRNVVQNHLFQHIDDRVAINTVWLDGQVWVRSRRGLEPLNERHEAMLVHPRTGILLVNRHRATVAQRHHQRTSSATPRATPTAGATCPAWQPTSACWGTSRCTRRVARSGRRGRGRRARVVVRSAGGRCFDVGSVRRAGHRRVGALHARLVFTTPMDQQRVDLVRGADRQRARVVDRLEVGPAWR